MKKNILYYVVLSILLAACAPTIQGGNYLPPGTPTKNIVKDSETVLKEIFPPAQNILYVSSSPKDDFGKDLIGQLRAIGYGVTEGGINAPAGATLLSYIIDQPDDPQHIRLLLYIGTTSLTAAWDINSQEMITPWTRGEL